MKIYRIEPDYDTQWVMPEVPEEKLLNILSFDCVKKESEISNIEWFIHNPKKKKYNFFMGINGALIFDQEVYDSDIFTLFEMAGQIIPIKLEDGEILYVLNVLECVNMLDKKNTTYDIYDDGTRGRILKYAFHTNRMSESCIFKIPETSNTEIFTYSDVRNEDDEFFYLYKKLCFSGLVFRDQGSVGSVGSVTK